jgi:hypothetical protein
MAGNDGRLVENAELHGSGRAHAAPVVSSPADA